MPRSVDITQQRPLIKTRTVNETTTSAFASRPATTTKPAGTGSSATNQAITDISKPSFGSPKWLRLFPYGVGVKGNTFAMRVIQWQVTQDATNTPLWVPSIICEFTCTIGSMTGASGATVSNTELFCDTISMVTGNANVDNIITSPANDTPASVEVLLAGGSIYEVLFKNVTSTSANALGQTA